MSSAPYTVSTKGGFRVNLPHRTALRGCAHVCGAGEIQSCHPVAAQAFTTAAYMKYPRQFSCLLGAATPKEEGSRL